MRWLWPWPFCHRNAAPCEDAQKQQIAASTSHILASMTRIREEATADLAMAAEDAKAAVSRRLAQSSPLRAVLAEVIDRQREQDRRS